MKALKKIEVKIKACIESSLYMEENINTCQNCTILFKPFYILQKKMTN